MNLFIIESEEEKTVEVQRNISMEVDISKLDSNQQSELLGELFENMDDDDIEDCVDNNDRMLRLILRHHAYIPNDKIRHMVYILEGDVDHDELEKDLMVLIEKYDLKDEL